MSKTINWLEHRDIITSVKNGELKQIEAAEMIGVSPSAVCREVKRAQPEVKTRDRTRYSEREQKLIAKNIADWVNLHNCTIQIAAKTLYSDMPTSTAYSFVERHLPQWYVRYLAERAPGRVVTRRQGKSTPRVKTLVRREPANPERPKKIGLWARIKCLFTGRA